MAGVRKSQVRSSGTTYYFFLTFAQRISQQTRDTAPRGAPPAKKVRTKIGARAQIPPSPSVAASRINIPHPKNARVFAPTAASLMCSTIPTPVLRSVQSNEERTLRQHCKRAEFFAQNVPVIKLDVSLAELTARPKNTASELAAADLKMKAMLNLKADACSGFYVDRDGIPLVSVWAEHITDSRYNGQVRTLIMTGYHPVDGFLRRLTTLTLDRSLGAALQRT